MTGLQAVAAGLALIGALYLAACEIERSAPVLDESEDAGSDDAGVDDAG
jgi:hypothetical protein